MRNIKHVAEVIGTHAVNQLLSKGWRVLAIINRNKDFVYSMGLTDSRPHGNAGPNRVNRRDSGEIL